MTQKLLWRQEKFQRQHPQAPFYHATFREEFECLSKAIEAWSSMKEQNPALHDENLDFLRQVTVDGKLAAFIFLELYTSEYRTAYDAWRQTNEETALAYISSCLRNSPQARSRGEYNSSATEASNAGLALHKSGDKTKALEYYSGLAHFQARHWKEAKSYLSKVFQKNPDNFSAREMMNTIEKMERQ